MKAWSFFFLYAGLLWHCVPALSAAERSTCGLEQPIPQVLYFFDYRCPRCRLLSQELSEWRQKITQNIPIQFNMVPKTNSSVDQWLGEIYFTAESLNIGPAVHKALFDVQTGVRLWEPAQLNALLLSLNISTAVFEQARHREAILDKIKQSRLLFAKHKIALFPSVVVNDRYLLFPTGDQSNEEFIKQVENVVKLCSRV